MERTLLLIRVQQQRRSHAYAARFQIQVYNSNNGVNSFAGYLNIIGGKFMLESAPANPPIFYSGNTWTNFAIEIVNKPAQAGRYLALTGDGWGETPPE